MSGHKAHQSQTHMHEHGPFCGHLAVDHGGHQDYLHDGKLHHGHGDKLETHSLEVNAENPATCIPAHSCGGHDAGHAHGPGCGKVSAEPKAIRPLHDRVLVESVKEADTSKGGIVIPDTAKEKPTEGHVLAVGSGKIQDDGSVRKVAVKVGDRVLFGKYGGAEVKIDGQDRLIIREDDILAVLER